MEGRCHGLSLPLFQVSAFLQCVPIRSLLPAYSQPKLSKYGTNRAFESLLGIHWKHRLLLNLNHDFVATHWRKCPGWIIEGILGGAGYTDIICGNIFH